MYFLSQSQALSGDGVEKGRRGLGAGLFFSLGMCEERAQGAKSLSEELEPDEEGVCAVRFPHLLLCNWGGNKSGVVGRLRGLMS